jgi:predicted RNase H-like HicB family nuclease
MEKIANLHIEKLPEGVYLATSDDIPGLVAQGRTIVETLEIARDVAKKLLEAQQERKGQITLTAVNDVFDYPLILGA